MTVVIKSEGLGKKYCIAHVQEARYATLRDTLMERLSGRGQRRGKAQQEDFWALRDVDLEIRQGERVGIIGPNGAGKSTLLKLLSRITDPSTGRLCLRGRVASLLEVGTGFHPELSGRENIYLNGAILSMSRRDIACRFDEIVKFAEVERFLDTPVKRYSSGMYMRLAFAVAAHLEPEILIVDEVLAVGDARFQKKCLGKMNSVSKEGRTVLFVSHNMGAMKNLCERAIVMQDGRVRYDGEVASAIDRYMSGSVEQTQYSLDCRSDRSGSGDMKFTDCDLRSLHGEKISHVCSGMAFRIHVGYQCRRLLDDVNFGIDIYKLDGEFVTSMSMPSSAEPFDNIPLRGEFVCEIGKMPLTPGHYSLHLASNRKGERLDRVPNAFVLVVEEGDFFGTGRGLEGGPLVYLDHTLSVISTEG